MHELRRVVHHAVARKWRGPTHRQRECVFRTVLVLRKLENPTWSAPSARRQGQPRRASGSSDLRRRLARTPLAADVSIARLASATDGCSLARLGAVCREAPMAALREDITRREVEWRHFEEALA